MSNQVDNMKDIQEASFQNLPCESAMAATKILSSMKNSDTNSQWFDISNYKTENEENLDYIKVQIRDGLDPDDLEEDEKNFAKSELGNNWKTLILPSEQQPVKDETNTVLDEHDQLVLPPEIDMLPDTDKQLLERMFTEGTTEELVEKARNSPGIMFILQKIKENNASAGPPEVLE